MIGGYSKNKTAAADNSWEEWTQTLAQTGIWMVELKLRTSEEEKSSGSFVDGGGEGRIQSGWVEYRASRSYSKIIGIYRIIITRKLQQCYCKQTRKLNIV